MIKVRDKITEKIISDRVFKALFINNENTLAKLISNLTEIGYNKLKDNITIKLNEIPIMHKGDKFKRTDFVVKFDDNTIFNIEANSNYYEGEISKNLSYVFMLYGNSSKEGNLYDDDKLIIQINLNAFRDKNSDKNLVDYMLRDKDGRSYIDNFKIINLDIVKCYKMYYNGSDLSNSVKWGAFLYSNYADKNVCRILDGVLDIEQSLELESRLEGINMDADGIMTKKEAREWGVLIKRAIQHEAREEGLREGIEQNNIVTIKRMLENGADYDFISKVTKKSVEDIKEIEKSMN